MKISKKWIIIPFSVIAISTTILASGITTKKFHTSDGSVIEVIFPSTTQTSKKDNRNKDVEPNVKIGDIIQNVNGKERVIATNSDGEYITEKIP